LEWIKTKEIVRICQICKKRVRRIGSRKTTKKVVSVEISKKKSRIKRVDKKKERIRDVFKKGHIGMTMYSYDYE